MIRPTKAYGFSLIELIVVIVILGILAITAVPRYMELVEDSKVADLKHMKKTIESYEKMLYVQSQLHGNKSLGKTNMTMTTLASMLDMSCGTSSCSNVDWVLTPEQTSSSSSTGSSSGKPSKPNSGGGSSPTTTNSSQAFCISLKRNSTVSCKKSDLINSCLIYAVPNGNSASTNLDLTIYDAGC